ncbi:MAG: TetR/AcrR family transcriptional regulator [Chloroflexi bacterium]|nr:TetR/AcrR family transcriptional regulator [Chloroflexota bacterium]
MPRQLNPERREKFLSAALQLFVTQGVHNTTTAEVARLAGSAAGTLFLYFPTKQSLVNELVLHLTRQQSAHIHALLAPGQPVRDAFFTIWSGTLHWFLQNPQAYQYVLQVRDSGIIEAAVIQESALYFDYYYTTIQQGLDEAVIKPYPIDLIGEFLYQDLVAMMKILQRQPGARQRDALISQGFDLFWNGIRK